MRKSLFTVVTACALLLAPQVQAQRAKLGAEWYADQEHGYRFRYLSEWSIIPVEPGGRAGGLIAQLTGPAISVRASGNRATSVYPRLLVWRLQRARAVTGAEPGAPPDQGGEPPRDIGALLASAKDPIKVEPGEPQEKRYRKLPVVHQTFETTGGPFLLVFDTYRFRLPDYDVALVYEIPKEDHRKFRKAILDSAKSFEEIERVSVARIEGNDHEAVLERAREEVERTPGWRVVETESQRFVIKTSSDDDRFLDKLIERLERSRDLFAIDYPPPAPIEHVSVVRVCATEKEFHQYGGTGAGTGGWFNPMTTELVIYDNKLRDRRETLCVISHEAFHQYCFFIFGRSEAHRWFDEGQGDFYGGMEFKGRKAIPQATLPGGYNRLPLVKEQLRRDEALPITELVTLSKSGFYGKDAVYKYAQAWSVVYMLRMGMLGEVPRKLWRPEYAEVLPSYMEALHLGFAEAYDEERGALVAAAEEEGETLAPEDLDLAYWDLAEERKQAIWDQAIDAAWGQVDLQEFEEHWKQFVLQHLK